MPDGKPSRSFHFAAGALSGVSTAVLLQPADLLKTRLQQSRSTTLRETLCTISAGPNPLKQLWRGTLPSAIRTGVGSALYFSLLASVREAIRPVAQVGILPTSNSGEGKNGGNDGSKKGSSALPALPAHLNLLAGATSRAAAGFVLMPVTVLKVRYESSLYAYTSLLGAGRDVLRTEGLRGFFAGFGATAVRDAPYAGLYVLFYEAGKVELGKLVELRDVRKRNLTGPGAGVSEASSGSTMAPAINFTSGILAAGLATALTNPFDAVKTRLQLMPKRYSNMIQAARLMLREEGVRSLFDGLGLRIARKGMSSALAWTVYEELVRRAEVKLFQASQESRL